MNIRLPAPRLRPAIFALALLPAMIACAGKEDGDGTARADSSTANAVATTPVEPHWTLSGALLAGRLAFSEGDDAMAAKLFGLAREAAPGDQALAARTLSALVSSGDFKAAVKLAAEIKAQGAKTPLIGLVEVGGDLEHRVMDEAWMAICERKARILSYSMVDPSRGDPGVCGGTVEVFVEPILPPAMVVVIGAGHVGKAVVHLAKWLGFRVAVSDDRAEFCTPESTPGADAYYPVEMGKLPEHLKINKQTFIVISSRGSNVDALGCRACWRPTRPTSA